MSNFIFQLTQIFSKYPWMILVIFVAAAGAFYLVEPPKSKCDTMLDSFQAKHSSWLAPTASPAGPRKSMIQRQNENCLNSNSPGGCFNLFISYRAFLDDLTPLREECAEALSLRASFQGLYQQLIRLLVKIAWGEGIPPELAQGQSPSSMPLGLTPARPLNWLEPADLALFCRLNREYTQIWGRSEASRFERVVLSGLPGDILVYEEGKCVNCETRRGALQVLPYDKARARSIFSVNCQALR